MVRYVECLFDYDGSPGQLSFRAGHLIEVLTQGDPHEWWEGKLTADDSTGWFPSAYCSAPFDEGMEGDEADDAAADAPVAGARARALYSFEASEDDELSFEAGDVLMVEPSEQAWWTGTIGDARGSFPSNYVEIIDEVPPAGAKPEVDLLGKKLGAALGKKRTPNRDARESDDWDEPSPRDEPPPPPPDGAASSPPSALGGRHGPPSVIRFEQLPQAEVGAAPREEDSHRTLLEGFIERPVKYDGYAIGARPLWQHLAFTDFFTSRHSKPSAKRPPAVMNLMVGLEMASRGLGILEPELTTAAGGASAALRQTVKAVDSALELAKLMPTAAGDAPSMVRFLETLIPKIRSLGVSEVMLLPCLWSHDDAVLYVLHRTAADTFALSVVNAGAPHPTRR